MKFLRLAFYVLIVQLVLSKLCRGEGVEETSSSSSSEINFDAGIWVGMLQPVLQVTRYYFSQKEWSLIPAFVSSQDTTILMGQHAPLMDNEHVTWKGDQLGDMNILDIGQMKELWISMPLRLVLKA